MLTTKTRRDKEAAPDNPETRIQNPECRVAKTPRPRVVAAPRLAFPLLLLAALVGVLQADSLYVRLIGKNDSVGIAYGVAARGRYAYVVNGTDLLVLSMADPRHPIEVGRCSAYLSRGVDVVGDYAYVAAYDSPLMVISLVDPTHPVEVGRCLLPGQAYSVVVCGGYAYVAAAGAGLRVVSVSDPAHPVEVGHYDTQGSAYHLKVVGDYAYVACIDGGLRIISIADPAHPLEVGSYVPGGAKTVAVSGIHAYIGCNDNSFRVISIADPADPVEVGSVDSLVNWPEDATMVRNYVFVESANSGLQVISVADPTHPREVAFYGLDGWSLAEGGRYLLVGGTNFLSILQFYQPGDLDIDPDSLDIVAGTLKLTDSGTSTRGAFVFANTSSSYNPDTTDGPSRSVLDSLTCVGYLVGPGDTIDSITVPNLPSSLMPGQSVVCTLSVHVPRILPNGDYKGSVTIAGVDTAHLTVEDSFYVFLNINRQLGDLDVDKDSLDVSADTIRLRPRLEVAGPPPVYTKYALGEFALTNTSTRRNPDTLDGPSRSPLESLHCTGALVGPGGTIDSVFILNPPASLALGRTIVCTLAAYVPPGFRDGDYTGSIMIAGTDTAGFEVEDSFYAIVGKLGDLDVARDSLGVVNDTIDLHAQPAGPVYSPYAKAPFMLVNTGSAYNPDSEDGPSRSTLREFEVEVEVKVKVEVEGQDGDIDSVYVLNLPESLAVGQAVECTLALVIPVGESLQNCSGPVIISAYDTLGYQVQDSFFLVVRGPQPRQNLDSLRVAPIPFKPNQNPEHDAIHFQGLSAGARVTVYDASGQTVWTATENGDGHLEWDARVASGIYVYLVVSADGQSSKVGKLSVIR
jgi:hypothetical protein